MVPEAAPVPEARDFDKTGNVRLLTSAEAAAASTAPTVDATVRVTKAAAVPVTEAAAVPVTEAAAAAEPTGVAAEPGPALPVPNYDQLSVPSLRARLRNLDVAQLRQLAGYEQAHADRADVIAMFERRIVKLQGDTTPEERGEAEAEAEIEAQEDVQEEVADDVGAEAVGEE